MVPWTARSVQFSTDNAGTWLMHCHVGDHITAGMRDVYEVRPSPGMPPQAGVPTQGLGGETRCALLPPLLLPCCPRCHCPAAMPDAACSAALAPRQAGAPAGAARHVQPVQPPPPSLSLSSAPCRTYYVQAEEVEWDYAPLGGDACSGNVTAWTEEQAVFTTPTYINPGSK